MKHFGWFCVTVASAIFLCAGAEAQGLNATTWRLVEIGGDRFAIDQETPLLTFEPDGNVSGDGGCNRFKGRFVTNGSAILLSPLAATMMLCEEAVSDMEARFLAALQEAREFEIDENTLVLRSAAGETVASLTAD